MVLGECLVLVLVLGGGVESKSHRVVEGVGDGGWGGRGTRQGRQQLMLLISPSLFYHLLMFLVLLWLVLLGSGGKRVAQQMLQHVEEKGVGTAEVGFIGEMG